MPVVPSTRSPRARRLAARPLWTWLLAVGVFAAQAASLRAAPPDEERKPPEPRLEPLPAEVPAPPDNPTTPEKAALGKLLFFDPRLSGDNRMSCASCHLPEKAWGDGLPRAKGAGGKTLSRNTPGLVNVGFRAPLFWDGRAASLEEQALGPIAAEDEMNQPLDDLERELSAVPGYVQRFQQVFHTPVTREGIAKALAAFQRTLVSPDAPLDRYLRGDKTALNADALRGMELFTGDAGCIRCHHGPLLSDGKFHRIGHGFYDRGRGAVTGEHDDDYKFRTPSLRDVARTAPYMHDGGQESLYYVAIFYLKSVPVEGPGGLPLDVEARSDLSFSDIKVLTAFLESLSGEPPNVEPPELP